MSDIAPRVQAAKVLARCLKKNQSLAVLLSRQGEHPQKALVQALCYGAARHCIRNRALMRQMLEKPLAERHAALQALILCGLYELQEGRRADHTLVNFFVHAARELGGEKAAGLCNALLRRYLRERKQLEAGLSAQARSNHPQWLAESIRSTWPDAADAVFAAGNAAPPMHIRVNLTRTTREALCQKLEDAGTTATPLEHSPGAVQLQPPADPLSLPGFREGLFSVQDLSAQYAAPALRLRPQMRVLDACAAPGGKSCHILELQPDTKLTALDSSKSRLPLLNANLKRLGQSAQVLLGDALKPSSWGRRQYSRILLDAPCSATGILRRQPDIRLIRTVEDVAKLRRTQALMLKRLWPLLTPGGLLLYGVCSVLPSEGEGVIGDFVRANASARSVGLQLPHGIAQEHGVQLLPGAAEGDGFYYALLRKNTSAALAQKPRRAHHLPSAKSPART